MAGLVDTLRKLPTTWAAIAVLAAAFVAGAGMTAVVSSQASLPTRVERLEAAVGTIRARDADHQREYRELRRIMEQSLCLQLAEKERTPWQECIQ